MMKTDAMWGVRAHFSIDLCCKKNQCVPYANFIASSNHREILVTKANLGEKRQCPACGARFYDLGKNPATCPKCRKSFDVNAPVRVRRKSRAIVVDADEPLLKAKAKAEKAKIKKPVKEIEDIDLTEFEDIETLDPKEEIEEIEEIEDIESLDEIGEVEDAKGESDDDLTLEDESGEAAIVDEVEDEEEEEEEDDHKPKRATAKKALPAKGKPKPVDGKKGKK